MTEVGRYLPICMIELEYRIRRRSLNSKHHLPTRDAIVLTKQHIIVPSFLSYGLHL
jgi:hypothetical protein